MLNSLSLLIESANTGNKWLFFDSLLFSSLIKLFLALKTRCEEVVENGFGHLASALESMELDPENGLPIRELRAFKKQVGSSDAVLKNLFVGCLKDGDPSRWGVEVVGMLLRACDDNKRLVKGQCSQNL